ncbi:MAG TPA: hypothetical protein VMF69_12260 [Gemmataceae bacterium]|nr:hypothetical protein [Gemmataceae bacterium]
METDKELFETAKPRRRWLKRVGCGLLILLFLALAVMIPVAFAWAWQHHLLQQRLDEALAELDRTDPGWRLEEIEAGREPIPEEQNSARVVIAASKLLPKRWPPRDFDHLFGHLVPEEQLAPEDFAQANQELEKVRPALEEARKLSKMPRGRHRILYERNTLETRLNDQGESRRIAILLVYDSLRHNQNGDGKNALTSCRAALNAARSIGDEPVTLSQLIRNAGVIISCQAIERTLAQSEPPPEELISLQRVWEMEDAHPDLLIVMRGERAMWHALFNAIEDGDVSLNGLEDVRWGWFDYALISIWRMDTREDHVLMLSLMARAIANAQLPMHEQIEAERQLDREVQEVRRLPRPPILTGLLMSTMSKRGESSRRTHACIRCTIVALAAERYRRECGAWPDTLEKLCPKYLTAVPLDPFDGEPLRYLRLKDGVIIYSVGQDAVDNGGNLDREHPNQPGADISFRLWDAAKRRQPPRPKLRNDEKPR